MSAVFDQSSPQRFLRPVEGGRLRRNGRKAQAQRLLGAGRTFAFIALVAFAAAWIWRQTQSDTRFAVRHIEITGASHTPRAAIDAVTARYAGVNLFKIDIARVQHDLGSLAWVDRIAIEKKIPDTLRINIIERTPVALLRRGGSAEYVDAAGVVLDVLTPSIGDDDLPLIDDAPAGELRRTVAFLDDLRRNDAAVYSRIAEIRPVAPRGFAVFDRDLATTVYVNSDDAAAKWRSFYAIARAEHLGRADIEYADLRFAGRVVLKANRNLRAQSRPLTPVAHEEITN